MKPNIPPQSAVDLLMRKFRLGQYGEVETGAARLTEQYPTFVLGFKLLAAAASRNNRLAVALDAYESWILLTPADPVCHYNAGLIKERQGDAEGAISRYRRAIELRPDFSEALNNLGLLLRKTKQLSEALPILERNAELNPDSASASYNLGNTQADAGELDSAAASFRNALKIDPVHAEANLNLGNILKDRGDSDQALLHYQSAIALKPSLTVANCNIGIIFYERGQYEKAIPYLQQDDSLNARTYLLRCYFSLGQSDQFFKLLDNLNNENLTNASIGSLISRAEIRFGCKIENSFANLPAELIAKVPLGTLIDFEGEVVKPISALMSARLPSEMEQKLLINGSQTAGNLFATGLPVMDYLESLIRTQIDTYRDAHKHSGEGFIDTWRGGYSLKSWMVRIKSGGSLAPHIHENGWLGGAVYIRVPKNYGSDDGNFAVCSGERTPEGAWTEAKVIDVQQGDLVLFPASLMHYTIPFHSDQERVVLAFDVIRD